MVENHRTVRAFVGKEIRRARELKGMSRSALAKAVIVSESLVAAWEGGRRSPQPDDLAAVEAVLGFDGILSRLMDGLVTARAPLEWLGRWRDIEARATCLEAYEPLVVPGLLQIEDYARALLRFSRQVEYDLEEQVAARLRRQRILGGDDPPALVAVLDEAVIRRPIGGPQVMGAQLAHLLVMAERPDIVLQVIPFEAAEYAGLSGAFAIAVKDGREFAYLDNAVNGEVVENHEDIAEVRRQWQSLRGDALHRAASAELIERAMKEWT